MGEENIIVSVNKFVYRDTSNIIVSVNKFVYRDTSNIIVSVNKFVYRDTSSVKDFFSLYFKKYPNVSQLASHECAVFTHDKILMSSCRIGEFKL